MKSVFQANDGQVFTSEFACKLYEALTEHPTKLNLATRLLQGQSRLDKDGYDVFYPDYKKMALLFLKMLPELESLIVDIRRGLPD